ncbi:hypothetical protein POM88_050488 [Heracleum sosnowskyi]|uniref:Uncharacterized protein n=1 Tax=Heracleum sosnowskyi TaxID=360622 RepID=A0AAD8GXP0_9APIA|nr:hypothetical protein POM88_050488 [Heracleum sosnowskyi]
MGNYCDDSMWWDELVCPPLEDYAFVFDTNFKLDNGIFDDLMLEIEEEENDEIIKEYFEEDDELDKMVAAYHKRKADNELRLEGKVTRHCGNHGKEKELPDLDEAEIEAIPEGTKELVEKKDKKRKMVDHSDCEPMQQREMTKLDCGNRIVAGNKRKDDPINQLKTDDYDSKLEASTQKLHKAYQ